MSRTKIEELSRIKYELERFFLGGAFDLCEDERSVPLRKAIGYRAEISYGKLVLSCWGDGWSRAWRVLACVATNGRLRLHCTKQMGRVPCVLLLRRGQSQEES